MSIMKDETFGPVVGIMPVDGDEQALQLMNDSHYGLVSTAPSIVCTAETRPRLFGPLPNRATYSKIWPSV